MGEPRLVRLNPNVPWKTRGNAALSARFGRGAGPQRRVGEIGGRPVWSSRVGRPLPDRLVAEFFDRAWERLLAASRAGDAGTDPALVISSHRLPARVYWRAVREIVPIDDARELLARSGARWRTRGSDRGLVGASAAVAWPGGHPTWELLAYRLPGREGAPRELDGASVRDAQRRFPALFLCHDPRTRRLLVAPHTPCPILYGLRATDREALPRARRRVRSEPVARWMLFRTNQATGDHLIRRPAAEIPEYGAGIVDGTVSAPPVALAGGHVRLSIEDAAGTALDCYAFEPTKTLPRVARSLRVGDRVRVWGSRSEDPPLRLEGLTLLGLTPRFGRTTPPRCGACDRRARSLGSVRGYRCPHCRRRWPPEAAVRPQVPPEFPEGRYDPTPSARRHLALRGPEP